MKVLITRPKEDAEELARLLEGCGIESVSFPLLEIRPKTFQIHNPERYVAVLVTSSNSLKSLEASPYLEHLKNLPLLAVGNTSADIARKIGFGLCFSADGDLQALTELVLGKLSVKDGPLLYLSGEVISGDLQGLLVMEGFKVDRVELYSAIPAEEFSENIVGEFANSQIDGIVLYSKRSAEIFAKLFRKSRVRHKNNCSVFCLSEAVASKFCSSFPISMEELGFEVEIASHPSQEHLLRLISMKLD